MPMYLFGDAPTEDPIRAQFQSYASAFCRLGNFFGEGFVRCSETWSLKTRNWDSCQCNCLKDFFLVWTVQNTMIKAMDRLHDNSKRNTFVYSTSSFESNV